MSPLHIATFAQSTARQAPFIPLVQPVFIQQSAPAGTVGVAYSYTFVATGSPTFALNTGSLPAGLSLNSSGVLSGTPTTATGYTFTVRATNGAGGTNSTGQSLTIGATGGIITSGMWAEIDAQAAAWGDPNNAHARINALPTTGTVLAPGGNLATAIAANAVTELQTGTYTPTGSLLSIPSGKKLIAGVGQFPVINLSSMTNFAAVYIGNSSVLSGIEFTGCRGISIITYDITAGVYSNGGTLYNLKVHDSGTTGTETDGTGISITGGEDTSRGQNWVVAACEVYNCWNGTAGGTLSFPQANGGNSDGIGSHFGAGQNTFIANNLHNNADDGIDMWHGGVTWHYFGDYSTNGYVPGVTNGGDGNGAKLGSGSALHSFYKTFANNNKEGGYNLNSNTIQPVGILSGGSGNIAGTFMNGTAAF